MFQNGGCHATGVEKLPKRLFPDFLLVTNWNAEHKKQQGFVKEMTNMYCATLEQKADICDTDCSSICQ